MTLEDFEKELAQSREIQEVEGSKGRHKKHKEHRKHHHSHHRSHHGEEEDGHRHKRRRRSRINDDLDCEERKRTHSHKSRRAGNESPAEEAGEEYEWVEKDGNGTTTEKLNGELQRDSWMEAPSALDIDYTQKGARKIPQPKSAQSSRVDFQLKIHENELNKHHLQDLADGTERPPEDLDKPPQHEVDYEFGDSGSQWRMTKLRAVYRQAEESGKPVEDVALDKYGELRAFDDAREEQLELERRETYGDGYVGKIKPSGELFQERKLDAGMYREPPPSDSDDAELDTHIRSVTLPETAPRLDQTALNKLKAQMMKARLRGGPETADLEKEYEKAVANSGNQKGPDVVVLGAMHSRMLAGSREGEVKTVENKRGRERGHVVENEDMTIEDMVREERRTRGQVGGEGQRFAETIAKDGKFDNDLEYMDENANKLAKRVQKSEINIRNTAVSDLQKMNRIIDKCPLCHQEDTNTPPVAPIVSLATRVYLTLPTEPEISKGGAVIVPIQHRTNLLECDEDEWEEIRNFMKSLTRMYYSQKRSVIFYENAATPHRHPHAAMTIVPLPNHLAENAPAFFREAILSADEEWTQHKKLIDTLAKARNGLGKMAFRRTLAKEMPYFHVWFEIDGGLGHIVEDAARWPKGDLFAREVIGGMLDLGPEVVKRQGKWQRGDRRVEGFRKGWEKFDWTSVLT